MRWVTCLARQTLVMDSPCPVVDTAPDSLSAYAPAPTGLFKDVQKLNIYIGKAIFNGWIFNWSALRENHNLSRRLSDFFIIVFCK